MNVSGQESCVSSTPRAERIARLNDHLRKTGYGGQIQVTHGVSSLTGFDVVTLMEALGSYDQFDADNDPHGERDFGDLQHAGAELLWKIDYYDNELALGSSDPADPAATRRVLTVMLASEY